MRLWFISCKIDGVEKNARVDVPASLFFFSRDYFAVDQSVLHALAQKLPNEGANALYCKTVGAWEYMVYQKDGKQVALVADTRLSEAQMEYLCNRASLDKNNLQACLKPSVFDELGATAPNLL